MGIYYYICRSNFAIQVTNHVIQYGFDIANLSMLFVRISTYNVIEIVQMAI